MSRNLEPSAESTSGRLGEGDPLDSQKRNRTAQSWSLRLWPGVALAVLFLILRMVLPMFSSEMIAVAMLGGMVCSLGMLIWWAFFSKVPHFERWGALVFTAIVFGVAQQFIDPSFKNAMMGMMFPFFAIPTFCLALVGWSVLSARLTPSKRRASLFAAILVVAGGWLTLRTDGMSGEAKQDFSWRWTKTVEDQLLASGDQMADRTIPTSQAMERRGTWAGFRGENRDGVVRGIRLETDWETIPPKMLWRHPVGPGASSFAVQGDFFFTQEQRGDEEVVTCYEVATGELVWMHKDSARFADDPHTGPGPRATPTLHGGRLYTVGATGILNALQAADGQVIWSRNAASDTKEDIPGFGFSGSPLIVDDLVVVAMNGTLAAYDRVTGMPRWQGPDSGSSYSSPKVFHIAGTPQIVLMSATGAVSVSPADGTLFWQHDWYPKSRVAIPLQTDNGDLIISGGERSKLRRISITQSAGTWRVEEVWTSMRLRPYHSDIVIHKGHAYGFDGSILACVDAADGERKWKGGRYGAGQVLLLPDQDVLFVLTEKGDLKLVQATPDAFTELAHFPALKGKTWNHPVLVGDLVLVRNVEEMMAFQIPLKGSKLSSL